MDTKKLIDYLKKGGYKVAAFYIIFNLISIMLNDLDSNNGGVLSLGNNSKVINMIILILSILLIMIGYAGSIGSFDELLNGNEITFKSFMKCGKKYFWGTMGYSVVYVLIVGIAALIPSIAIFFLGKTLIGSNSSMTIVAIIEGTATQVFATPYIFFNVLNKETKGYIKKNFKLLLVFGISSILITFIPVAGKYIVLLLDSIYYLLVLMLHKDYSHDDSAQILVKEEC